MDARPATERQVSYILTLYGQVHDADVTYLSQCHELPLTRRERSGGMTFSEASRLIDKLKRQLTAQRNAADRREAARANRSAAAKAAWARRRAHTADGTGPTT